MKRATFYIGLALLSAAVGFGVHTWRRQAAIPTPSPATSAHAQPLPLQLQPSDLYLVQPAPLTESIPITGTLNALETSLIRAKVAGVLRALPVREGTAVQRDQTLGQIDPTEAQTRVQERRAAWLSAQAQFEQNERVRANTQRLHAQQFMAQSALDQATAAVSVARGQRDAAAAQLALARTALADTRVTAPMTGIVAERYAQVGEKLAVDSRVLALVNLKQLEMEAAIPASVIQHVHPGAPVELRIEGLAAPQQGRVARIGPSTQPGTRLVPIYITLDNTNTLIRAGVFAQGRLSIRHQQDALAVPLTAIHEVSGQNRVYVLQGTQLSERPVSLGVRADTADGTTQVAIQSGLAAGEVIVATALGTLPLDRPVVLTPASAH